MRLLNISLLFISLVLIVGDATAGESRVEPLRTIKSCTMADGTPVALKAESHGEDGVALYVDEEGKAQPAFTDMSNTDLVGNVALAQCVHGALIFALDYGPPYRKGAVIRRNLQSHAEERIDFAEKALPRWLYLSDHEMLVVVPNLGGETDKKYIVYQFIAGKGQLEESMATDKLPVPGHELLPVRPR